MIILKHVFLTLGTRELFTDLNCTIQQDQKIGVVGRNGTGKSTLLKVLARQLHVDSGEVVIDKSKKIGYMPQEMVLISEKTVYDEAFSVFQEFIDLEKEKDSIEQSLAQESSHDVEKVLERYTKILELLSTFDRAAALSKTEYILDNLGFSSQQKKQSVNTLSVGWKMRVVLAKLLLQEADFYLFDEPTNHLDLVTKEWFFDFLQKASCGFLLVTHDRYFLENLCQTILELESGKATIYNGNFTTYLEQKEQQRAIKITMFEKQEREIAQKQATIDRFRAGTKARMAQAMMKKLEAIERIEIEPTLPVVRFSFPPTLRSGRIVLTIKNLKHAFDHQVLFNHVSCEIERGQKIALIAPNGTGKTTLFNLITGKYPLQQGTIEFGHNVQMAYFEQDQSRVLKPDHSIWQEVLEACPDIPETTIRSFLGSFLFSGDDIYKKIKVLSGGEKNRVAMVKMLLKKANFLLLDEPTNHLDIYAQDILLQALKQYDGTILVVSHDHNFIQQLADHILELTPQGIYSYSGTFESYLERKKQQSVPSTAQPSKIPVQKYEPVHKKSTHEESQEHTKIRTTIHNVESQITKFERERDKLHALFNTYQFGTKEYAQAVEKLNSVQKKLDDALKQWEELVKSLEY